MERPNRLLIIVAASQQTQLQSHHPRLQDRFAPLDTLVLAGNPGAPQRTATAVLARASRAEMILIVEPASANDPDGRYLQEIRQLFADLDVDGRARCYSCSLEAPAASGTPTRVGPRGRSLGDLAEDPTLEQIAELLASPPRIERVGASAVRAQMLSDRPAEVDQMGFAGSVSALASFLADPHLAPPLVVSVEGGWGSGKSSFLMQLRRALRLHGMSAAQQKAAQARAGELCDPRGVRTVWFNAWSNDSEVSAYSSFALTLIEELGRIDPLRAAIYRVRLALLRFDWNTGWRDVTRLIGGLSMLLAAAAVALWGLPQGLSGLIQRNLDALEAGKLAVFGVLGVQGARQLWKFFGSPFDLDLQQHIKAPDYAGKKSLGDQHFQDIGKIIGVYSGKAERIIVFVDDLDRCDPAKVAEVTQAISVILANAGRRLIYVLAIDREKVAASIAARNKDIAAIVGAGSKLGQPIDFGHLFLEKLIQVPFRIPVGSAESLSRWIKTLDNPNAGVSEPDGNAPASPLAQVVALAVPFLRANPRRVKQFVNLLRLRLRLLEGTIDPSTPTLFQIAKLTIAELLYPAFIHDLSAQPYLLQTLLLGAGEGVESESYRRWSAHSELLELLLTSSPPKGTAAEIARHDRHTSLLDVDIKPVLRLSTRMGGPKVRRADKLDAAAPEADFMDRLYQSLVRYGQEYETIRRDEPYSPDRTAKLDRLFRDMTQIRGLTADQARQLFGSGEPGKRVAALASCAAERAAWAGPLLLEALERSRSPFEKYHALRTSLALWAVLEEPDQRAIARAASQHIVDGSSASDAPIWAMLHELAALAADLPLHDEVVVEYPQGRKLRLSLEGIKTFNTLTDRVYVSIGGDVRAYYYGTDWYLENEGERLYHRRELEHLGVGSHVRDDRPLTELGIRPGSVLHVRPRRTAASP